MNIATRLKELRKGAGYSQEQLAEILHISRQAVSKWESAQGNPDIENIIKLAEIYQVTTDYILLGVKDTAEPEIFTEHSVQNSVPENTTEKGMHPETRKILGIIAIILAIPVSGALFIALLSLITEYFLY